MESVSLIDGLPCHTPRNEETFGIVKNGEAVIVSDAFGVNGCTVFCGSAMLPTHYSSLITVH